MENHLPKEKTLRILERSFGKFVPMPISLLHAADLSDGAKVLFLGLLSYAWYDAQCWPGEQRLANDLHISVSSVKRHLGELVNSGVVSKRRRGLTLTNCYLINDIPEKYRQSVPYSSPVVYPDSSPVSYKVNEDEVNKDTINTPTPSGGYEEKGYSHYPDKKHIQTLQGNQIKNGGVVTREFYRNDEEIEDFELTGQEMVYFHEAYPDMTSEELQHAYWKTVGTARARGGFPNYNYCTRYDWLNHWRNMVGHQRKMGAF